MVKLAKPTAKQQQQLQQYRSRTNDNKEHQILQLSIHSVRQINIMRKICQYQRTQHTHNSAEISGKQNNRCLMSWWFLAAENTAKQIYFILYSACVCFYFFAGTFLLDCSLAMQCFEFCLLPEDFILRYQLAATFFALTIAANVKEVAILFLVFG